MKSRVVVLATLLMASAAHARPVLTVFELHRHHQALAGKQVEVRGWLSECRQLGCYLAESKDGLTSNTLGEYVVLIGDGGKRVEASLRSAAMHEVVLRARVTRSCWRPDVCVDRADNVIPLSVSPVPPASKGR